MEDKNNASRRLIEYAASLRKISGITTKEVSEKAGVKSQYISRLESGSTSPTLTSFIGYLDGIECEIEIVRKDHKNDYKALTERLVKAFEEKDQLAIASAIADMKTTLILDEKRKEYEEEKQKDMDLILDIQGKFETEILVEAQKNAEARAKRLKAYKKESKKRK
jgi:transcriptional regulator with XRE-family HTH domain